MNKASFLRKYKEFRNSRLFHIIAWGLLVCVLAMLVYIRFPLHFDVPNFYAEDGKIFAKNIIENGWLAAAFTPFNGYLVLLQYVVAGGGFMINAVAGGDFVTLSKAFALASYLTIAFACSLPWLLFRKQLGTIWSLVAAIFLVFVPLGASDFTVIGTVGNLKFLFFYIACLLVMYRVFVIDEASKTLKKVVVDILISLCVLTNIAVIALLPFLLLPHRAAIVKTLREKNAKYLKPLFGNPSFISAIVVVSLSALYLLVVLVIGIPKMPGYLDGPVHAAGLMNSFYRASWYGVLYPLHTSLNHIVVAGLLLLLPAALLIKNRRWEVLLLLWAIFVSVVSFVVNRPGVTEFLIGYTADGGPGQFFYGGTMIFIFGIFYLSAPWFNQLKQNYKLLVFAGLALYAAWAFPLAGDGSKSYDRYDERPAIYQSTRAACSQQNGSEVSIQIYPADGWSMEIDRRVACDGL